MMRAGLRRHRVTFQRLASTADSFGEAVKSWSTLATRWALIEFETGTEGDEAGRAKGALAGTLRTPYTTAIRINDRFQYDDRIMQITAVVNTDRRAKETIVRFAEAV